MRRWLWFLLLVPACSDPDAARRDAIAAADADAGRIECAIEGAARFERVCTVERLAGGDRLILMVRAPNGSFRRLEVTGDGRGVAAADGAEPARVTLLDGSRIEVAIAGDRYRLPATLKE